MWFLRLLEAGVPQPAPAIVNPIPTHANVNVSARICIALGLSRLEINECAIFTVNFIFASVNTYLRPFWCHQELRIKAPL